MAFWAELQYEGRSLDRDQRVWKAFHPGLNWTRALKQLEFPSSMQAVIQAELEKVKSLEFPQGVKCFEYYIGSNDAERSTAALLLDYYPAGSLEDQIVLPKRNIECRLILKILHQLTSALAYLGGVGLSHGHLKPKRIMLSSENVEIAEVGLSMFGAANVQELTSGLSQDLECAKYYAPERWQQCDAKGDVWALGVIAFELFQFHNPFMQAGEEGVSVDALYERQSSLQDNPFDWSPYPQIPKSVQDFITACLTFSPANRPDATALLQHPVFFDLISQFALQQDRIEMPSQPLGIGAFGRVWKVSDRASNWVRALKEMKYRPSTQLYVDREIGTMKDLSGHPNMIQYFDHETRQLNADLNETRLLLEYCGGGNLSQAIINPKLELPPLTIIKLIRQLTKAIAYIHDKSIIHRDIKPENILLTSTNVLEADIKVCDFGMSRQTVDIKLAESNGEVVDITPNIGTAKYSAPELLNRPFSARKGDELHQHYDNRVDVWALGLVAFELFTFENPFIRPGESIGVPDIKRRQQPLEHAPLDWSRYPQVPLVVQEFVNLCLTYNREQRPYSQALLEQPLISPPLEELRLTYSRPQPTDPIPSPPQLSLLSLQEESLEFNNRALQYIRNIGTVCGPEAAYEYATRYKTFILGDINFIRKKSPQDTEDWRRQLEEISKIINSFKKPQQ